IILSFNLTGYLIYQFFVDFNAHCYSPFWSINDKRLHNLNYIPYQQRSRVCAHRSHRLMVELKVSILSLAPNNTTRIGGIVDTVFQRSDLTVCCYILAISTTAHLLPISDSQQSPEILMLRLHYLMDNHAYLLKHRCC
ncbi:hypothetical protein, partial [Endozoicomonas atrinae]|uniref:hypothetical protein n=1 Tax=Endozoicomonas atrinae TaxID=1333660 RepID=UPI001EE70153